MKIDLRCIGCNLDTLLRIMNENEIEDTLQRSVVREYLEMVSSMDLELTPVHIGRIVGRSLKLAFAETDPFRQLKKRANAELLGSYAQLREKILSLSDPLAGAIRLSAAGNVIDFGPGHKIDINATIERALESPFTIDDIGFLREKLQTAESLLVIGDNCGEAVLDKLLLEVARVPRSYFAFRSAPALNDVTLKEAKEIGMDEVAVLLDSGVDAPGASEEFMSESMREAFSTAEVVISKGQGNFEGLSSAEREIFFLFMAKCDVIASFVKVERSSFVALRKAELGEVDCGVV